MSNQIAPMTAADWPEVARIYRQGIDDGNATFETATPSWAEWDAGQLDTGRLVARLGRMEHRPYAGQWRDVVRLERRSSVAGND